MGLDLEAIKLALEENPLEAIDLVDDILERYTNDEAGQSQKDKYKRMTAYQKLKLLENTLIINQDIDDFTTDLVINFDYCNY